MTNQVWQRDFSEGDELVRRFRKQQDVMMGMVGEAYSMGIRKPDNEVRRQKMLETLGKMVEDLHSAAHAFEYAMHLGEFKSIEVCLELASGFKRQDPTPEPSTQVSLEEPLEEPLEEEMSEEEPEESPFDSPGWGVTLVEIMNSDKFKKATRPEPAPVKWPSPVPPPFGKAPLGATPRPPPYCPEEDDELESA